MVKRTCDRCGKELEAIDLFFFRNQNITPLKEPRFSGSIIDPKTNKQRMIDLCDECEEKLLLYIFGEEGPNDQ